MGVISRPTGSLEWPRTESVTCPYRLYGQIGMGGFTNGNLTGTRGRNVALGNVSVKGNGLLLPWPVCDPTPDSAKKY
jgi:hypothetical protein